MKKCTKCDLELKLEEFNWKKKNIKRSSHCKSCSRKYIKEHYRNNQNYYLKKAKARNDSIKRQGVEFLASYLLSHPCVDCGETDIRVLEFDHVNRRVKEMEVSKIIRNTASIEKLKLEVNKCEVRCANCHRRKTALEDNNWKLAYIKHP